MNAKCFIKYWLLKYEIKWIKFDTKSKLEFIYLIDSKLQSEVFHVYVFLLMWASSAFKELQSQCIVKRWILNLD